MDWMTFLEYVGIVIEVILSIPLFCGLLLIIFGIVGYAIYFIIEIIRWLLLKFFDIELNIGDLVLKFIDFLSSIWSQMKKTAKIIWWGLQFIFALTILFLFIFGIPILNRCTGSEPKNHNEEDIEYYDDATPPRGVPSRYW